MAEAIEDAVEKIENQCPICSWSCQRFLQNLQGENYEGGLSKRHIDLICTECMVTYFGQQPEAEQDSRTAVLKAIIENPGKTRNQLADLVPFGPHTVRDAVREFLDDGIVKETKGRSNFNVLTAVEDRKKVAA